MPPDNQLNVGGGQFAQATGGGDALRAAFQKRGIDASVLDQVSDTAPTGPSNIPPNLPAPQGGAIGQPTTPQPIATPQAPEQEFRSAEMGIALKALQGVVKTENKIAESVLNLQGLA